MHYKWETYLPVMHDPYDESNQHSSWIVPAETLVTLSDMTQRPVEAISLGDRILTQGSSKISTPISQKPVRRSVKTRLVGFSEYINSS